MRMADARVTHYRPIRDSGVVEFDPEITGIVGAPGSGKTSFLRMLSGVSDKAQFGETDLPRGSEALARLRGGSAGAGEITQLLATFRVEDADRPRLPPEHRGASLVGVRRTLAGGIALSADGREVPRADVRREADAIARRAERVAEAIRPGGGPRGADAARESGEAAAGIGEGGAELALRLLRLEARSAGLDRAELDRVESDIDAIGSMRRDMARRVRAGPWSALYRAVPKPAYRGGAFDLEDDIDLDRFIADPLASRTFACVALACSMTPAGVSRARSAGAAERGRYLSSRSSLLGARLGKFWRREGHALSLEIDGGRLRLGVADGATGTAVPPSELSGGLRWRLAFDLDILSILAGGQGRAVVLLDNPATELDGRGKCEVLRHMEEAAASGRIQLVYATHERALVDPRRAGRVRVARLTAGGARISTVRAASSGGMLEQAMGGVGAPARYSLFGAPRTVAFEEASDMYIAAAANELVAGTDPGASLDRDVYSLCAMGGAAGVRHALAAYEGMGIDFVVVVGRGADARGGVLAGAGRRIVEVPAAGGGGGACMEDLVDRSLYYEAFRGAYGSALGRIPAIDEIDPAGGMDRPGNYRRWLEGEGEEYSRTLVALRLFGAILGYGPAGAGPGREGALGRTRDAFAGLFAAIKAGYADAAPQCGPHAPAAGSSAPAGAAAAKDRAMPGRQ